MASDPPSASPSPSVATGAAQERTGGAQQGPAAGEAAAGAATAGTQGGSGRGHGSGRAHGPGLIAHGAPCKGYFPAQARADEGEVRIEVIVDPLGHTRATTVLTEVPKGHGFGLAASACASHLHFDPAVDDGGARVAGRAKLLLRFQRG